MRFSKEIDNEGVLLMPFFLPKVASVTAATHVAGRVVDFLLIIYFGNEEGPTSLNLV